MKRMLFNATHAEELRVAIVEGQRLIDIDIESAGRESRKSNIYQGVITRIEPGLEACFVSYGEDRHGFLPFKEVSRMYFKQGIDVGRARIQDALTEGQTLLVQVEKEERGNKGASLTTFISLAGRYLVLMPNNPRGGGVSRRVEGDERQELRETMDKLEVPQGMSIIARTAGIGRSSEELQWDLSYLMQLWRAIDGAKGGDGAYLIYAESSLVIRAIRDYFTQDIGEILIDNEDVYEQARQFMGHVMPANVSRVKRYRDDVPLYSRFQIESQIETAHSRNVPLPSGGSIVIDHTEALVAIDVNSARATKGADIEETAFRTNVEAAEEAARQMRLRDLGGLIVIDFIDMESSKNQREVENRIRDALHYDRARVQYGKISKFGLLELSRQRLRPALNEGSHLPCPRCNGTGVIRDIESTALHVLRQVQDEAMKENSAAIHCQVPVDVATYLLNEKRPEITTLEARTKVEIVLIPNRNLETPHYKLERLKHDDDRLANYRATYTLAESPAEENSYLARKLEPQGSKQVAVVQSITPAERAPMPVEAPPAPAPAVAPRATKVVTQAAAVEAREGFFGRLLNLFKSKPETPQVAQEEPVAATLASATKPERADRSDRNSRRRDERPRGGRDERRNERGQGQARKGGRDQQGERVESAEAKADQKIEIKTEVKQERSNEKRERGERPPRGERTPRPERAPKPEKTQGNAKAESSGTQVVIGAGAVAGGAAAAAALMAEEQAPTQLDLVGDATPQSEQSEGNSEANAERKGRNRRGRGGRDNRERRERSTNQADSDESAVEIGDSGAQLLAATTASGSVGAALAATIAPATAIEPEPVIVQAVARQETVAIAVEPSPVISVAPTEVEPLVSAPTAMPVEAKAAPLQPTKNLDSVVESAGLVWVQTASTSAVIEPEVISRPKAGRKPRPKTVIVDEPLQMVETGKSSDAST